jgi:SAM-dependent methyltransferase
MAGMSDDAIALCLAGGISPQVAVARLLLAGGTADDIAARIAARCPVPPTPRWQALAALIEGRQAALDGLAAEIGGTLAQHDASGTAGLARIAAFFDRAVAFSPEASVALYSLGDPEILRAATTEVTDWLLRDGLVRPASDVLDLGCGIGRMATALAPHCRSVLGLDVAPGMVAEAQRRCAHLPHTRFAHTAGTDLAAHPDAAFDLVLAVDSFPYMIQAGVADRHVADAHRLLREGGALVILNLSYGRTPDADRADVARWCDMCGFVPPAGPVRFTLWDGTGYVLRR